MQKGKVVLRFLRTRPSILVVVIAVIGAISVGAAVIKWPLGGETHTNEFPTFAVERGPLKISVTESGTIQAREQVIIKNEVEGRTTIISLIPEGTHVKEGDLLVELDSSQLLDSRIDRQIDVQNAEAAFIQAGENLAVVENQAQSNIEMAELTLEFARQDLQKYLEGEYPNQLKEKQSRIILADEELQRAEEILKWSKILSEEKYLSQTELQADQLYAKKKKLDLELARNNLDLLENFTYHRRLAELESDVKQAEMAMERTNRKARADVVQAEVDLTAKKSKFNRQQRKLEKVEEQIEKTRIYAPADGLVIYATSAKSKPWRSKEPLDEGQEVREREELIYLPTTSQAKADIRIHETSLEKVNVGLEARITVGAIADKVFTGRVAKIALLPDSQSAWLNPDLKIYNTEIHIDGDGSILRSGMSCKAEIIVEYYDDTIYIPLQAVIRIAGEPTVYVWGDKSFEPRKVEIGLDNNRMVRIINGLQEGEVVLLTPPLAPAAVEPNEGFTIIDRGPTDILDETIKSSDRDKPAIEQKSEQEQNSPNSIMFDGEKPTDEQMDKMRQRFEKMSPEEREKMRQQRIDKRRQGGGE